MIEDINLWVIIPLCLVAITFWVGLYVFMFLTVMRVDPREQEFREGSSLTNTLLPTIKK
jgi:uncharacterized protein YpmS